MSSLRRDLFERRLWPVAVLIVAAIVAAPFLLHSRAKAAAAEVPPAPSPASVSTTAARPVTAKGWHAGPAKGATAVDATGHPGSGAHVSAVEIRHELRARVLRDPFAAGAQKLTKKPMHTRADMSGSATSTATTSTPASSGTTVTPTPTAASASDPTQTTGAPASTSQSDPGSAASSGGASAPATTTMTVTTTATATATTPTTTSTSTTIEPAGSGPWTIYGVDIRVGVPGHFASVSDLARLTPLPSVATPKVMFTGVLDQGRQAVFAIGDGVKVTGPGLCRPDHAHCSAIVLKPGQIEALTYFGPAGDIRTFELSVSRISSKTTTSRSEALAAYQRYSKAGQCELELADPVSYDQSRGALSEMSKADCRHTSHAVPFPGELNNP